MTLRLNPRLKHLSPYPFQRLAALLDGIAPACGPGDGATLSMSIGEPTHAYPSFVSEILDAHRGEYGVYPPAGGTPDLRRAIAAWLGYRYGLRPDMIDADRHVQPLSGTREGLYMLAQIVCGEQKGAGRPLVLLPNPFYQCYEGAAVVAGAVPYHLPCTREGGFLPDLTVLDEATLSRTALLYLCSPANPQGAVADHTYLANAIKLARQYDFVVALDECYSEIYDQAPPTGALEVCDAQGGDMSNVVVFHSLSKRSSVPGLRAGFCAGDEAVVTAYRKLRDYGGAPLPLPIDAAATALWRDESHVQASRALYQEKLDIAERVFKGRFDFYRPPGGFFLWLDVGDGEAAAVASWCRAGIRVLPGGYLGSDGENGAGNPGWRYIRIALVHDAATTEGALERIAAVI